MDRHANAYRCLDIYRLHHSARRKDTSRHGEIHYATLYGLDRLVSSRLCENSLHREPWKRNEQILAFEIDNHCCRRLTKMRQSRLTEVTGHDVMPLFGSELFFSLSHLLKEC